MEQDTKFEQAASDGVLVRRMGAIVVFAALAGVARLGQDAAVAWRFGTGAVADAYYFVLSLTNWPLAVALSFLTLVVVPADVAVRHGDAVAAKRFRAELLGGTMLVALLALPLAGWTLYAIVDSQTGGAERTAAARSGIPGVVALVPLGIVGALLSAWLMALGRRVLTLLEALPPLVLAALVLIGPASALFWGMTAGAGVQVLAMALLLHRAGELPRPRLGFSTQAWRSHSHGIFLLLIGQSLFALVPMVDSFFAVRLDQGEVAAISYVNRLVLGLVGLAGLALQRAGLPLLSQLSVHSPDAALRTALRWTGLAALVGALMGIAVAVFAEPVVSLLFARGRFTAANGAHVALLLRLGMAQLPFFLASLALTMALAVMHARRTLALISCAGLVAKVALSAVLVPAYGVAGLLLAAALMYGMLTVMGWVALRRRLRPASNLHPQLRVLQVSTFFASHVGGLEVVADQLARRVAQAGVRLTWMAGGQPGEEPAATGNLVADRADYVDVLEHRIGLPAPIWSLASVARLWRHVGDCDVVHVHDYLYMPSLTAMLFAWLRRRPVVMTQHIGDIPFESRLPRLLLGALNRSLGRWALRRAAQVVFVGMPVMQYFDRFAKFRRPPRLISNGVDHALYRPREDAACADDGLLHALFVGRFVEKKGVGLLRRCVDMPGIRWDFVGSGPMLDPAWAAEHPTVHLHGRLGAPAVAERMRAADVLVLPSKGEGFPLVVQEALSCGTPVLVSKAVGEAFPRNDPRCVWSVDVEADPELAAQRLAERLAELRDDLLRVRGARLDAQRLAAQWSWDECVAAYLRIYSEVATGRESPAM